MKHHVLITGGAGFIGSHIADELLTNGHRVRALDNLTPQVHGLNPQRPAYLNKDVELIVGDVRDPAAVERALQGVDVVMHFAAAVGVGQSMYEIAHYTSINNLGTAVLLESIMRHGGITRLVVASSMSIYGEGLYRRRDGSVMAGTYRPATQLQKGHWELLDDRDQVLEPLATSEAKQPCLSSVYALTKYDQERMCLLFGSAYRVPTVALRLFNVYGPRQALSNPYTGVMAIFAARLLNNRAPLIFEDGLQQRDFVSVHDVARACRMAMESEGAADNVFNIGSGERYTVRELAQRVAHAVGREHIQPEITGKYRVGDIRHCFADISLAKRVLGYRPIVTMEEGLAELAQWLSTQVAVDRVTEARAELDSRGLTV